MYCEPNVGVKIDDVAGFGKVKGGMTRGIFFRSVH
jgi:hypothetical protein